ncbi:MAG: pantoate--beta-alanine ligase [Woeseiaceae bacterium]
MQTITDRADLRQALSLFRRAGERVAIVPTMGSLHAGHLSLVGLAQAEADRVVVTVFVNPTQFGENEDFDEYPRTLESDAEKLRGEGVDVLFAPATESIYPFGIRNATRVLVPVLADEFCGAGRPGHFDGVTSVVARLFALVRPDVAIFGQKDYQQQLLVRRMVEDLGLPIDLKLAPIVRESNGLAMSSRNAYLSAADRDNAVAINQTLQQVCQRVQNGERDFAAIEAEAAESLSNSVDKVEYLTIRQASDLTPPDEAARHLVVLAAAAISGVRLIDNELIDL